MIKKYDKFGTIASFYKDLLQVVIGNYAVVYCLKNLDDMYEVGSLQTMNQFMDCNAFVDTGFKLFVSENKYSPTGDITCRVDRQIESNARTDLFFSR